MQTAGMEIEGRDRAWAADCCGAEAVLACLSHTNDPSLAVKGPATHRLPFMMNWSGDELGNLEGMSLQSPPSDL